MKYLITGPDAIAMVVQAVQSQQELFTNLSAAEVKNWIDAGPVRHLSSAPQEHWDEIGFQLWSILNAQIPLATDASQNTPVFVAGDEVLTIDRAGGAMEYRRLLF